MKEGFYVDDLVSGQATAELYEQAKSRIAMGGCKLRKWLTNDRCIARAHTVGKDEDVRMAWNWNHAVTRLEDIETFARSSLANPQDNSADKVLGLN